MKKIISILTVLSVLMITQWNLQAQRPHHGPPHRGPQLEKLAEELNITDDQKAELEALRESHMAEAKALREKEFETPEARREAMKSLRTSHQEAVESILTPEQLEKVAALKQEKQEKRKAERKEMKEDRQAMHEEVKAYKETKILPVLREQRAKLEAEISEEDKETLNALRAKASAKKEAWEKRAQGEKRERPERTEEQKEAMRANRETIKGLVEKYDTEITGLLAELEDEHEQWKEEMKAIHQKYAPEDRGQIRNGKRKGERMEGEKGQRKGPKAIGRHARREHGDKAMGKVAFLLLDPNEDNTAPVGDRQDFAELKVYPNPSTSRNTVAFELKEAGYYRVELRDKDGLVLRVISSEYRQAGDYQEEIDLSSFAAGTYFVSIVGAEGVISKKVVVAK